MKYNRDFEELLNMLVQETLAPYSGGMAFMDTEILFDYFYQLSLTVEKKEWDKVAAPLFPENYTPQTHKKLGTVIAAHLKEFRGCVAFLERDAGDPPRQSPEDMEQVTNCFVANTPSAISLYKAGRALLQEANFKLIHTISRPDEDFVTEIWSFVQ